jgi:hypothetical protein
MSRYDDLRRMREAKFAAKAVTENPPLPVTKPQRLSVTKPISVTKPARVPPKGQAIGRLFDATVAQALETAA